MNYLYLFLTLSLNLLLILAATTKSATTKATVATATTNAAINTTTKSATTKATVATTTKSATTGLWLQNYDNIVGCYGGRRRFYQVFSNNSINSTLSNFFDYFVVLPVLRNVNNANLCCSRCGTAGTYSSCIGFDFNSQTNICQMYAIKKITVREFGYDYIVDAAQADFLLGKDNGTVYVGPTNNRWTGVFVDGTGDLSGIV
jgi:hypothetical protein